MRVILLTCALVLLFPSMSSAQSTAALDVAADAPIRDMDSIVVSGSQPGPGMWKVSKGTHVMYVLGTLSPLPNDITWQSRDVENVIAQAGAVLGAPSVVVDADIGFFRGMLLVPSMLKAGKNPDDATLQEVLPADLYARWSVMKERYIGRDSGIEKKRPILAANELYQKALEKSGLGKKAIIGPVVDAALKRAKLKRTDTSFKLMIDDPKAALKEMRNTTLSDVECLRQTLDRIERELPLTTARANAWAIGDLDALRKLPDNNQNKACINAWTQADFARKRGFADIDARIEASWMTAVENALMQHPVTFASLSIGELLKPDGYLVKLQAKGYLIEAPE